MRILQWLPSLMVLLAASAMAATPTPSQDVGKAFTAAGFPGSCAVSFDGNNVLTHYTSGYADVAKQKKYKLDTIQPIASIGKTFVGLALARLAIEKKLDLDAPIDDYLPWKVRNPHFPNIPITLRELATHTSSLIDAPVYFDKNYEDGHTPSMSQLQFVKKYTDASGKWFSAANFTDKKPGTHHEYSNMGANLAAVVIEYRTGVPFDRYVSEHFFKPLGMKDTSYTYRASARNSTLYDGSNRALKPYTQVNYADGRIRSTCVDMTKYFQAVLRARAGKSSPLSADVVAMALAPQFKPEHLPSGFSDRAPNQGLFWAYSAMTGIGHSGSDPGVSSFAYIAPDKDRGFVVLGNESLEDKPSLLKDIVTIWQVWRPYK
ncbi:MAG: serine hydrolase domain-containing protein [Rhodanobacter sp.]